MRINKKKATLGSLVVLLILLQERFLYMVDTSLVLVISMFGLAYLLLHFNKLFSSNYTFGKLIMLFFAIQFYGILLAKSMYGQSIVTGIIGVHYVFIYALFFLFAKWLRHGNVDENIAFIKRIFIYVGTIIALLLILQSLVYPFEVFKLTYGMRNGLRIQGCHIIQFSFAIAVCDAICKFNNKKIFSMAVMGYYLVMINQARNVILVLTIILGFILYKKLYDMNRSQFYFAVVILPVIFVIGWNCGLREMFLEVLSESKNIKGTSGMRVLELGYYFDLLKKSKYLGIGVLGDKFSLRNSIYGADRGYYLEDIGVSAFIFKTGIVGLIWTICYELKIIKLIKSTDGWIKYLTIFLALKTLMSAFFSVSFIFDIRDGVVYLVIILAMIDACVYKNRIKGEI